MAQNVQGRLSGVIINRVIYLIISFEDVKGFAEPMQATAFNGLRLGGAVRGG